MERRPRGRPGRARASLHHNNNFGLYCISAVRTHHIEPHIFNRDFRRGNCRRARYGAARRALNAVRGAVEVVYPCRLRRVAVWLERDSRAASRTVLGPAAEVARAARRTVVGISMRTERAMPSSAMLR